MGKISLILQRDIFLVPFPFSDQSGKKVRPVIVISNSEFNEHSQDCLVVGITSNISREKYSLKLSNAELEDGKLFMQCCVKVENILKIDQKFMLKKIGKVNRQKFEAIIKTVNTIISIDTG